MGFAETYIVLLALGVISGILLLFVGRVLIGGFRGQLRGPALSGALLFGALLLFALLLPDSGRLLAARWPHVTLLALAFSLVFVMTTGRPRRFQAGGLVMASILLAGVFFVVTAYAFVTGDFSRFRGEELVALVEVETGTLGTPMHRTYALEDHIPGAIVEASTEPISVKFPAETPSVDLTVHTLAEGKLSSTSRCELPGNLWGIGGQVIEVDNWLLLFGGRTFYRLTTMDAKFSDNRLPHVGENLPGYDPMDLGRRLEELVPVVDRKLKDFCRVRQTITDYDFITYTPASRGRRFGIYARRDGGFVPRPLDPAEFSRLLEAAVR